MSEHVTMGGLVDQIVSLTRERDEARAHVERLREALQEFVDKCDRGEARSTRSYAAFRLALAATPAQSLADVERRVVERCMDAAVASCPCWGDRDTGPESCGGGFVCELHARIMAAILALAPEVTP